MANIVKRIEAARKAKVKKSPDQLTDMDAVIAKSYINDIKDKTQKDTEKKVRGELETQYKAELEETNAELSLAQEQVKKLDELLKNERSQTAQLTDLVKSLKAEVNNQTIAMEKLQNVHESAMAEHKQGATDLNERIKTLEIALIEEKNRPAPVVQSIPRITPSSFTATPIRGQDGKTISVTLEPVYERPN